MAPFVNSEVSYAKATVSFPIYAAEFDPYNRGYLVVAGGGGESRTGIPNQISVLDVSNRATIEPVIELDLSRDEDSVQSLANLATKDGLITFAGINSSRASVDAGNNEHFRSFEIRYPPRKKQKIGEEGNDEKGEIKLLGKRRLFQSVKAPKQETYQRLLRLSPARKTESGSKRLGAIATSLAKTSEIVVFSATSAVPDTADVLTKISLPDKSEAADLDIIDTDNGDFSLVYCDDHAIHEQTFDYDFTTKKVQKHPDGPRRVFPPPTPGTLQYTKTKPKFRCIRFLNSENVIVLVNKPNKTGAELRIYRLYPSGPASLVHEHTLPHRIRQASGLDVCVLDADRNGNFQVAVAVAGQDISIEVLTTNYSNATQLFSSLRGYLTLRHVHNAQITKLCFAPFHSPLRAPDPDTTTVGANGEPVAPASVTHLHPGPQYVRLASTSYERSVVIDTFPLSPLEPQKKDSRYVLSHPGDEAFWRWAQIFVFSFVILVMAFIFQSFRTGFSDEQTAGPFAFLPEKWRNYLDAPAGAAYNRYSIVTAHVADAQTSVVPEVVSSASEAWEAVSASVSSAASSPSSSTDKLGLRAAVEEHLGTFEDGQVSAAPAVVVRDAPHDGEHAFDVDVHPDKEGYLEKDPHAKHWHELADHQKAYWKGKLKNAGEWAEDEGESVLKGVLWSVAGQVLREL